MPLGRKDCLSRAVLSSLGSSILFSLRTSLPKTAINVLEVVFVICSIQIKTKVDLILFYVSYTFTTVILDLLTSKFEFIKRNL